MQDSWRVNNKLSLELGLRYDYYSVVKEADGRARPFFVEENAFGTDPDNFYDPDKNNFSPRLSAAWQLNELTVVRSGFGLFYGPGQFEDRIQPIENYIERRRVGAADIPNNGLAYPVPPTQIGQTLSIRGYTHHRPDEYNVQYGASVSRELPGAVNLTVGYTGSQGKDMFLRGVSNTLDPVTLRRQAPLVGQVDYKTSGCIDDLVINGNPIRGCGYASYNALQISATRRFRAGFTGGMQYQFSKNKGTTQGSNEAGTASNTFDYETEYGTNPQDIPHTFNGSMVYQIPGDGIWGGWRVGGIVNARSGAPLNVTINRPDNVTVNGVTVTEYPGRQHTRHAAARPGPRRQPVHRGRRRALDQPGGVHDAAAGHVRQPAAQLPARTRLLAGRPDGEQGLPVPRRAGVPVARRGVQHHQPPELREPGRQPAQRHAGRALHRRAGRDLRLHAGAAEPHGRPRHGAADADLAALHVLDAPRPAERPGAVQQEGVVLLSKNHPFVFWMPVDFGFRSSPRRLTSVQPAARS